MSTRFSFCKACRNFARFPYEERTEDMRKEITKHLNLVGKGQEIMDNARRNCQSTPGAFCYFMDFGQTVYTPLQLVNQSPFNSMKDLLKNFSLTFTDLSSHDFSCFMWTQCQGVKGSNEAASCLWMFTESLVKKTAAEGNFVREINLFADKDFGPNINKALYICLLLLVQWLPVEEINLTLLDNGHSESENDDTHNLIEKAATSVDVYTLEQLECAIREAVRSSDKPFRKVVFQVIQHTDIKDFQGKELFRPYNSMFYQNCEDRNASRVFWKDIRMVSVSKRHPHTMYYKYGYTLFEEPHPNKIDFEHLVGVKGDLPTDIKGLPDAYENPPGISNKKKQKLLSLIRRRKNTDTYTDTFQFYNELNTT